MRYIIVFLILIWLAGCRSKKEPAGNELPVTRSTAPFNEHELSDSALAVQRRKEVIHDSIMMQREMEIVMQYAEANKEQDSYDRWIDTTVTHDPELQTHYRFGHIFSADRKHLILMRYNGEFSNAELYLDILILEKGRFRKLVSDSLYYGYYRDTLRDLNGDGFPDLALATYSSAGCCPREDETVYIYLPRSGDLSVDGFFNPEYFPAEKLVYEMDYGHPGEVALSKYRWLGTRRELVETIAPTMEGNNIFKIRKPYTFTRSLFPGKNVQVIPDVPPDFKRLRDYEYFVSYQE